jgi:HK97 family phage major capsid protein
MQLNHDRAFVRACIGTALDAKHGATNPSKIDRRFADDPITLDWIQRAASTTTTGAALRAPGLHTFMSLVSPRTVLGRLARVARVPFRNGAGIQTGGGTFAWVKPGDAIPTGEFTWTRASLPTRQAGGIIVLSEELLSSSTPGAELVIERQLVDGLVRFTDTSFLNPAITAVTDERPASITNVAADITPSGTDAAAARTDILALLRLMDTNLETLDGVTLIMSEGNAVAVASLLSPGGSPMFPGLGAAGGEIYGVPVLTSAAALDSIVAVHGPSLLLADEGGVSIDASTQAAVEFTNPPTNSTADPTAADLVSLWQTDSVGLRVLRELNFEMARADGVAYIAGANYGQDES